MWEYKGIIWTGRMPWKEVWERVQVGMPILHVGEDGTDRSECFYTVTKKGDPKKLSLDLFWVRKDGSEGRAREFYLPPSRTCYCIPLKTEMFAEDFL